MTDPVRQQPASEDLRPADLDARSGDSGEESQHTIRERVIRLAFGGDSTRYDDFVRELREATPAGVEVILRGSAVTGHKWRSPDEPFDADGPGTSDLGLSRTTPSTPQ